MMHLLFQEKGGKFLTLILMMLPLQFENESKTISLTMLWYPAEDRITFGDHGSTEFGDNQISLTFIAAQLRIIVPRLPGS